MLFPRLLLLLTLVHCSSAVAALTSSSPSLPLPPSWSHLISQGNMLYSTEQPDDGWMPSLGNGFLAGDIGCCKNMTSSQCLQRSSCGKLHLAGVFNKSYFRPEDPSFTVPHRAAIPNPFAFYIPSQNLDKNSFTPLAYNADSALDMSNGIFYNRTILSEAMGVGCSTAYVTLKQYIHRRNKHAMIVELELSTLSSVTSSLSCTVPLTSCSLSTTDDFDTVTTSTSSGGSTSSLVLSIKTMETPPPGSRISPPPLIYVAGVYNPIPPHVTLSTTDAKVRYIAVYHSTLEPNIEQSNILKYAEQSFASVNATAPTTLLESHIDAWQQLWSSGVEMTGNRTIAAAVTSSFYYIYCSIREDWSYGLSPGGLVRDSYQGHSFWDTETHMLPGIAVFQPSLAWSMLQYRLQRLAAAADNARLRNITSATAVMFPWESSLIGYPVSIAPDMDAHEIHINGDIALATQFLYFINGNMSTLSAMYPVVSGAADFFLAWSSPAPGTSGNWTLNNVVSADERPGVVNSSVFTNVVAAKTMAFANDLKVFLNLTGNSQWLPASRCPFVPVSTCDGAPCHPEYDGYRGDNINQADVALLQYPLKWPMSQQLAINDLNYYQPKTSFFFTGNSAYSIAWLRLGNRTEADRQFFDGLDHQDLTHFNVWRETSMSDNLGGNLHFITGAGDFIQNLLMGYVGLDYNANSLSAKSMTLTISPQLPPGVSSLTLRRMYFYGNIFTITYTADVVTLVFEGCSTTSCVSVVVVSGGARMVLNVTETVTLSRQLMTLSF